LEQQLARIKLRPINWLLLVKNRGPLVIYEEKKKSFGTKTYGFSPRVTEYLREQCSTY